jgi:hypothetical protein
MTKKRSDDFHYQSVPGKTKRAFNLNRYLENSDKKSAKNTVLSGGEHNPAPMHQSDGKREKIVISSPETKATTTMKIKESVFEQEQAKNRKSAEGEYKRSHKNALDSSRGYHVDNQRYSHTYDNAGNHFMHVTTHDGKFSTKFAVHHKPDGVKLVLAGYTHSMGEGRALTVAQRLQRGRQLKRIAPKLKRAAKRALTQSPSSSRIWKRSERAARNVLKKRFSPVKGVPYAKLTTTQKIFVDKALEKRQKLIRKVAKRLLPKVRQASFKRLQAYRAGTGRSRLRENEAFEAVFNQRPLPQIVESMIINMGDHPMAGSLMTLLDLAAEKDSPAVRSLKEKAESIKVPFAEILQVYADALLEYKRTGSKLSGEQYAFNAVNVYVADHKAHSINENFENMAESVSFKSHGEEEDGHHLLWKGKKYGDLKLVSSGISPSDHKYTLHKSNGEPVKNKRKQVVALTKSQWQKHLHPHFEKHDALKSMKTEESETDTMVSHMIQTVKAVGPKNVAGVAREYAKISAKEAKEKASGVLTKIRAAAKRK